MAFLSSAMERELASRDLLRPLSCLSLFVHPGDYPDEVPSSHLYWVVVSVAVAVAHTSQFPSFYKFQNLPYDLENTGMSPPCYIVLFEAFVYSVLPRKLLVLPL